MEERLFALLQVSALVGGGAALLWLLRRVFAKYSSKWRCLLLAALCVRLLIPFRVSLHDAPVKVSVPAEAGERVIWQAPERENALLSHPDAAAPQPQTPHDGPIPNPPRPSAREANQRTLTAAEALSYVWLAGAVITLLRRVGGSLVYRRRAMRRALPAGGEMLLLARELSAELGVRCPTVLTVRAQGRGKNVCTSPMLTGLLKPVLLLPEGVSGIQFVLRHELTHLRRRDLLLKLLSTLAVSAHWFNPLIRLLERQLDEAIECACDERVLANADGASRRAYSDAILAAAAGGKSVSALSTCFSGGLKARLKNIFLKKRRRGWSVALLCALAILGAGALVACHMTNHKTEDQTEKTPEPEPLSAVQVYDLAFKYRFDIVPLFEEGLAPKDAKDYVDYAFYVCRDDPSRWKNDCGYVSKSDLEELVLRQFGVTELKHDSTPKQWDYDGEGYTAVPMGGPEQMICVPDVIHAAWEDGRTVYTVNFRVGCGSDGLPDTPDFEAARAAAEKGEEYTLDDYSLYKIKFWMNEGVPSFLCKSFGGDDNAAELFDMAREYRFDYVPMFRDENAPADARAYLYWLYAVGKGDPRLEKDGNGYLPVDYVEDKVKNSFGVTRLAHATMEGDWIFDGDGYAAVPQGMKELPICFLRGIISECDENGQLTCTVTLDFCSLNGNLLNEQEEQKIREALLSGSRPEQFRVDSTELFRYILTSDGIRFLYHEDVTPSKEESPESMYYDYFSEHGQQINPLFPFSREEASDDDLMVFAIRNLPFEYDYETGIAPGQIDAVLQQYFGRTVTSYDTGYTDVLPSGNVQPTGWSFHGCNLLVLQQLKDYEELYTGTFDVYYIPEGEPLLPVIESDLRAGRTENRAQYLSGRAEIQFQKIPDTTEPQGFYLKYVSVQIHDMDDLMFNREFIYPYRDELLLRGVEIDSTERDWAAWYDSLTPIEEFSADTEWNCTKEGIIQEKGKLLFRSYEGGEFSAQTNAASGELKLDANEYDIHISFNGATDSSSYENPRAIYIAKLYKGNEYLLVCEVGPSDDPGVQAWKLTGGLEYLGYIGREMLRCDEEWRIVSAPLLPAGLLKERPIFDWHMLGDKNKLVAADPLLFEGVTFTADRIVPFFTEQSYEEIPAGEKLTINAIYTSRDGVSPSFWQITRQNGDKQLISLMFGD